MRYVLIVAIVLLIAIPGFGASSFLGGFSGNILTPDAVITPDGTWEASFHSFMDVVGNDDLTSLGIQYGLTPNVEVGAAFLNNGESDVALNAKFRVVPESASSPAIVVGVFDVAGSANSLDGDAGFYAAISKNITRFASDVAGEPSKPLRLTVGAGSGVFDGFFAGLDWTLQPRLSLMAEFFGGAFGGTDSFFNVGGRFAVSDALRLDVGLVDFDNFTFGASFRTNL